MGLGRTEWETVCETRALLKFLRGRDLHTQTSPLREALGGLPWPLNYKQRNRDLQKGEAWEEDRYQDREGTGVRLMHTARPAPCPGATHQALSLTLQPGALAPRGLVLCFAHVRPQGKHRSISNFKQRIYRNIVVLAKQISLC